MKRAKWLNCIKINCKHRWDTYMNSANKHLHSRTFSQIGLSAHSKPRAAVWKWLASHYTANRLAKCLSLYICLCVYISKVSCGRSLRKIGKVVKKCGFSNVGESVCETKKNEEANQSVRWMDWRWFETEREMDHILMPFTYVCICMRCAHLTQRAKKPEIIKFEVRSRLRQRERKEKRKNGLCFLS